MAILGFFLVNNAGGICLTRYGMGASDPDITSISYIPASRIAAARLQDGTDEVFVDAIDDATHAALVNNPRMLVVHMSDASKPIKEYKVAVEKK